MVTLYVMLSITLVALAYWHSDASYRMGLKHGQEREAMRSKHARQRIIMDAEIIATKAWLEASRANR